MSKVLIIYAVMFAGGIAGSLMIDASWGVYLYQLNYFINPPKRWWFSYLPEIDYSFIISAVLLISFLLRYRMYEKTRLIETPPFKWIAAFFLVMICTTPVAVWPAMHTKYLISDVKGIIIIAVAYKVIDSPQKFRRFIWTYLIGIFYISWVAWSVGRTGGGRLEGIGMVDAPNSNGIAAVLVSAVPLLLFYLFKARHLWQRFMSFVILSFVLNAIILINSRGSFLALIVSCAYLACFFLLYQRESVTQKAVIISGVLFAVGLFVYLTDATFWGRMNTFHTLDLNEATQGEGIGGRIFYWLKTFDLLKDYPFGAGGRGYTYLSPNFIPADLLTGGVRAVHSTFFQALAEFGYFGFLLFICLIGSVLKLSRKARKYFHSRDNYLYYKSIAVETGFLSFLAAAAFVDRLHTLVLYWSMLFIMCFFNVYVHKAAEYARQEDEPVHLESKIA